MSKSAAWLNRDLIAGPYLFLATTETEYKTAMRHLRIPIEDWSPWVTSGKNATMHHLEKPSGGLACIVCIQEKAGVDPIQVCALLVHEAVHIWQRFCDDINERNPSEEFEAYSIQTIAQRLMYAYKDSIARQPARLQVSRIT